MDSTEPEQAEEEAKEISVRGQSRTEDYTIQRAIEEKDQG